MSYSLIDKNDVRNLIKKCPECGIIWIKVDGCPNVTCGERMNQPDTLGHAQ